MRVLERKTYMTDMKPKFDIEKLNLHYGAFHALKDINMQIDEHKITAFIGPSGCGKSTFLKTLNRMNDLVEGVKICLLYTSPSPRDLSTSRMPSSA